MNLYNADHIANSKAFRDGWDYIALNRGWDSDTAEDRQCKCHEGECMGDCQAGYACPGEHR